MCRQQWVGYPPHMTTTDIFRDGLTMTDFPAADAARSRLLANVAERSGRYLTQLRERRVEPGEAALAALKELDVPLQDAPLSAESVIEELDRVAAPATVGIAGPRYFGFVNGGALPAALAANWLSTAWEQNGAFQISA